MLVVSAERLARRRSDALVEEQLLTESSQAEH
jgi:hypothetical protein